MTFDECELAILRLAVDKSGEQQGQKKVNSPEIKRIITILENFLRRKKQICYGGTAINNILPKQDQFYNKDIEIPDYDFLSATALEDAKELVDIYVADGFQEVEAKSGKHHGTYKVFVNFIPVADITYIPKDLFNSIKKEAIQVAGISYSPPNLLRMNMYLELSRPAGDTSRWEKVLKRLTLLNKHYPLSAKQCSNIEFQRQMDKSEDANHIYETVQRTLIDQDVVFLGGYALSRYSQYMPKDLQHKLHKIPDFDVLSEDPLVTAQIVKERLLDIQIKNVKIIQRPGVGEIIAPHYEIRVGQDTIAFVYEPLACHSYNMINDDGYTIKIATIDTMLSFWLAFLYADRPYYDKDRILCMSKFLFDVQEKNRLEQKGLLRRFSINCMGHHKTIEEMRAEKAAKFHELDKNSREYEEWFLRYRPLDKKENNNPTKKKGEKEREKEKEKMKSEEKPQVDYDVDVDLKEEDQEDDQEEKGNKKKEGYHNNKPTKKKRRPRRKRRTKNTPGFFLLTFTMS